MPPPLPRCSGWAYSSLISPSRVSLPRKGRRVSLHIDIFEACSAFTRVAACTLALSPIRDTLIEGFSHFVTSMTAPIASGWSGCRMGLAPTGKRRLCTAHTQSGRRALAGTEPPRANEGSGGRYGSLRHLSVHLGSQHHTFLSRRFIARAYEYRGLRASIHGDVQHVCRNEEVISRLHDVAILELIARPQFHFIAPDLVGRCLVMLVHVRAGSFPGRQANHSEPNRFRADGFCTYPGLVIAALLGAIARAALDHKRFFRGSKST